MRAVFEFNQDTELYDLVKGYMTWTNSFFDHKDEIGKALDIEFDNGSGNKPVLLSCTSALWMQNVPEELNKYFCQPTYLKTCGYSQRAKKSSKLHKKFIEVINELGVKEVNSMDITWSPNWPFHNMSGAFHKREDRYFFTLTKEKDLHEARLNIEKKGGFTEVSMAKWYEMEAAHHREREEKEGCAK